MRPRLPFILCSALALSACEPAPGVAPGGSATPGPAVGSIALELTTSGGLRFAEVSYDIHGNGFHRAATFDVANSTTISAIVGGIPVGTGYGVRLTAQDVAHQLTGCQGEATFDVASATTVAVPVHVTCRAAAVEPPPPPSVPVPRPAVAALAGLLLALGSRRARASSARR